MSAPKPDRRTEAVRGEEHSLARRRDCGGACGRDRDRDRDRVRARVSRERVFARVRRGVRAARGGLDRARGRSEQRGFGRGRAVPGSDRGNGITRPVRVAAARANGGAAAARGAAARRSARLSGRPGSVPFEVGREIRIV